MMRTLSEVLMHMMMHNPLHPGLVVKDALIDNTGLTVTEAADRIGVTRTTFKDATPLTSVTYFLFQGMISPIDF